MEISKIIENGKVAILCPTSDLFDKVLDKLVIYGYKFVSPGEEKDMFACGNRCFYVKDVAIYDSWIYCGAEETYRNNNFLFVNGEDFIISNSFLDIRRVYGNK